MVGAETGLKGFIEVVGIEVGLELCGDYSLEGFRDEGEVGDGAVVVQVSWVGAGFFDDGGDCGHFKSGGDCSRGEGGVDYVSYYRGNGWDAGFDKGSRKGV